jgi:hypothetical protein
LWEIAALPRFPENGWIGHRLVFGSDEVGRMLSMMMRDLRCMMIDLFQDTNEQASRVLKAVAHLHENNAGDYAAIEWRGHLSVGESVSLIIEI